MALPIGTTPTLRGKEAAKFITALHRDAQKKVGPAPTPKLEKACRLIEKHAESRPKRIH